MQTKNAIYFQGVIDSLKTRRWRLDEIPADKRQHWQCFVCDKIKPQFELIAGGVREDGSDGEPFWLGTSCIKEISKAVGFNLAKFAGKDWQKGLAV